MTDADDIRSRASDVAEGFRLWCCVLSLICLFAGYFAFLTLHSLRYLRNTIFRKILRD